MTDMNKRFPQTSVVTPLIEMFNVCPVAETALSYDTISKWFKAALKRGYIIDPSCVNEYSVKFINNIKMDYNNTFYKTWDDVTNKSRLDLLVDQLIHYTTTYGVDFSLGNGYVPNNDPETPEWTSYKSIKAVTFKDLFNRCVKMLESGSALKSDTVKKLTDYIIEYCTIESVTPNVDAIKNREALVILCDALNVLPMDGAKLFAHIIYKATGETMIVKNRELRERIKNSFNSWANRSTADLWKSLSESQLMRLAEVFNRYKPLFIAFKTKETKSVINKIGHLSKTHHKPMQRGFWETLLGKETYNPMEVAEQAKLATNFKLLQVMQSVRERFLMAAGQGDNMYIIRNGKVFVKPNNYNAIDSRYFNWEEIYTICKDQLVENLSAKACTVKFPAQYTLTCPTSEKNFIGDFPMGTSVEMGENSVMGIYWRNEWGTRDFDLSFNDIHGNRIGWNASYYSEGEKVIYSGDMTNAEDGANEVLHFKKDVPNGIVSVNRYYGEPNSKYRLYFGTDDVKNITNLMGDHFRMADYMVDPNNIQLEAEVNQGEMREQMIGVILDSKFYFYTLSCGYGRVTTAIRMRNGEGKFRYNADSYNNAVAHTAEIMKRKTNVFIPLKEILLEAGFKEAKKKETPELDLTSINRDTLIDLFSKE